MVPFIDIHTHHRSTIENVLSVKSYFLQELDSIKNFPFTAGIHPWHVGEFSTLEVTRMLDDLLDQPNCIGIGETGLDKKSGADFSKQLEIFETHLHFAYQHKFPLIIHQVGAWNEMISYLRKSEVPFIFHGFKGNREITSQLLKQNCCFSFGFHLQKNESLQELIKQIPINRLFFESDESQDSVYDLYLFASRLLNLSPDELKEQVFINFNEIFKIRNFQ